MRTADPKSFYVYYPCIMPQDEIEEAVHLLEKGGKVKKTIPVTRPPAYEEWSGKRDSYDTPNPVPLESFGPTKRIPLGDLIIGRSGDKGPNVNVGFFTDRPEVWEWLRNFLTLDRMKELIGKDWKEGYRIERVEFPTIYAVRSSRETCRAASRRQEHWTCSPRHS